LDKNWKERFWKERPHPVLLLNYTHELFFSFNFNFGTANDVGATSKYYFFKSLGFNETIAILVWLIVLTFID
jgi:hypothetical protein